MSSLKTVNMTFTTHTRPYIPPPPSAPLPSMTTPQKIQKIQKKVQIEQPIESYLYKSNSNTNVALTVKQSLASMFKNIQVKKSCRSCGGFK